MADLKVTQLTADTAPTSDDLVPTVNDPLGTPANRKVAISDLFSLFPTMTMARQAIINGGFNVSQRNGLLFSSANPAAGVYLIDRWAINSGNTGTLPTTITHSQQAHTAGDIWGAYYFYRIAPNGAGSGFGTNDFYLLQQPIENGTRFLCGASKKVTVSFWARTSIAGTVKMGIGMQQNYGTGGSPTAAETLAGNIITLTSSWAKYTLTFTTNTLVGKTFGTNNDDSLKLMLFEMWGTTIGTNNLGGAAAQTFVGSGNIDISQVQVCAGDTALPFYPRDPQTELALCQRYYEKSYDVGTAPATNTSTGQVIFNGTTDGSGNLSFYIPFKVRKRIQPNITFYQDGGTSGSWNYARSGASGTGTANNNTPAEADLQGYISGIGANWVAASINGHWTADAEL